MVRSKDGIASSNATGNNIFNTINTTSNASNNIDHNESSNNTAQMSLRSDLTDDVAYTPVFTQQPYVRIISNLFSYLFRQRSTVSDEVKRERT